MYAGAIVCLCGGGGGVCAAANACETQRACCRDEEGEMSKGSSRWGGTLVKVGHRRGNLLALHRAHQLEHLHGLLGVQRVERLGGVRILVVRQDLLACESRQQGEMGSFRLFLGLDDEQPSV